MRQFNRKYNRGISLVELMISFSVAAILLTLAGTSMKDVSARSEIRASTGEVVQALRSAKHAARLGNTSVTAEIKLAENKSNYIITFALADRHGTDQTANLATNGIRLVDIELSDRISVNADITVFKFDSMGMVDQSGTITLTSRVDDEYASTVVINNTMGFVTSSYNTPMEETS